MNSHTLPRALFAALVAGAAAVQTAVALPPTHSAPAPVELEPVRVQVVDDATLSGITGKYFGASMLVGLRIDLVSTLHNANGTARGSGSLLIQRNDSGGFDVRVDTRTDAAASGAGPAATGPWTASGGGDLQIDGIGQVTQIAGDGNWLSNLTTISFTSDLATTGNFNGRLSSHDSAGPMTARVTFLDDGVRLDLSGPGALLGQQLNHGGNRAQILQFGQIAGNGMSGSNRLHLQILTAALPELRQRQLGVQQALSSLIPLSR